MLPNFSSVIAGTMLWGQWGRKLDTNSMSDLIQHCLLHGITTFDHADIYGGYTTEADFGTAYIHSGIKRADIQLISKCGIQLITPNRENRVAHYDYTQKHIIDCCERSLANLKTDYLDVFLLHRPSPLMDAAVIGEAISKLKEQGKILSFGLSNFTPSQSDLIRQYTPVSYNQIEFSLTHHMPMTDGSLDHMRLHHIRPLAWAPLGIVFKDSTPQTERIQKVLQSFSKKYDVDDDILLLNWILRHPSKIIPVAGTADKSRISRLRLADTFVMDQEDWFELWEASMGQKVP
jgi:predicted oxidoreductase